MNKFIFLLGHRQGFGKDSACDIFESIFKKYHISYHRTYFAKKLKVYCAEKYRLDFSRINDLEYKKSKPEHLNGLTVRDVLIKEGNFSRTLWENVWVYPAYEEILLSKSHVGLISDFRFPNEYVAFDMLFDRYFKESLYGPYGINISKPTIVRVLVSRKSGKCVSDGADDQLSDSFDDWDEVIHNDVEGDGWKNNLEKQIHSILVKYLGNYHAV